VPEIFINYRTDDCNQAAAHIESYLSGRFGSERVFRDSKSIRPGDDYRVRLEAASSGARALLVLIGPGWAAACDRDGNFALANENDWIRKEILNAMNSKARIIPVLCGRGLPRLTPGELPPELKPLADLQSLDYDTGNVESCLERIGDELLDLVPGLVDRGQQSRQAPKSTQNINYGNTGNLIQAGEVSGSINYTTFNGPTGPVSSGSGNQNFFSGDGTNYIAGNNSGGINQTFDKKENRDEQR
jgi:TIR domain-containing protein